MPDRNQPGHAAEETSLACPGFFRLANVSPLSERQRQVLSLAARGLTERGIAQELWIAPRTVQDHLRRARQALGALNTTHAVAIALTHRLIGI